MLPEDWNCTELFLPQSSNYKVSLQGYSLMISILLIFLMKSTYGFLSIYKTKYERTFWPILLEILRRIPSTYVHRVLLFTKKRNSGTLIAAISLQDHVKCRTQSGYIPCTDTWVYALTAMSRFKSSDTIVWHSNSNLFRVEWTEPWLSNIGFSCVCTSSSCSHKTEKCYHSQLFIPACQLVCYTPHLPAGLPHINAS